MRQTKLIIWLLSFAIIMVSCTKENNSNCGRPVDITITIKTQVGSVNEIPDDMKDAKISVYDQNGNYVTAVYKTGDELRANNNVPFDLPLGTYTFMLWGGDFAPYQFGEKTTIRTHFAKLTKHDNGIVSVPPGMLYHSMMTAKVVEGNNLFKQETVKDNNLFHFAIKVDETLPTKSTKAVVNDIEIMCMDNNGYYNFDNTIDDSGPMLTYIPYIDVMDNGTRRFDISVLRLLKERNMRLIIRHKPTQKEMLNINIIDKILENPDIKTNDDLDRIDEYFFDMELKVNEKGFLSASISINGYKIEDVDVSL